MNAGPRSAKAIADSALALLPDTHITSLKGIAAFDKFKDASQAPKVILASTKSRATPLYKSLSLSFKGRLTFALVGGAAAAPLTRNGRGSFCMFRKGYHVSGVCGVRR